MKTAYFLLIVCLNILLHYYYHRVFLSLYFLIFLFDCIAAVNFLYINFMHSHVNALLIVVVFWSDSLWYWRYKSISPVYNNFTSFFPVCIPLFSFSCLTALPNASRTMLNNSSDSRHFCHIHNSIANTSVFIFSLIQIIILRLVCCTSLGRYHIFLCY